jgi:phage replication O-like protein O
MKEKKVGFIKINTKFLEELAKTKIPGQSRQILDVILRKTYGWNKRRDKISISQFEKMTGIDRKNVKRARNKLQELGIIIVTENGKNKSKYYEINLLYKAPN